MSAKSDHGQRPKFSFQVTKVLKAEDLNQTSPGLVTAFTPMEIIRPRVETPKPQLATAPFNELKQNLNTLKDLHSRLQFMLKELEQLLKD